MRRSDNDGGAQPLTATDAPTAKRIPGFNRLYGTGDASWVIGSHQPALEMLVASGLIAGRVLDIGCGDGRNAAYLAQCGFDVVGVDFSADAVSRARSLVDTLDNRPRIHEANIFTWGNTEKYDTIIDCAFLHGLFDAERLLYVDKLQELCADRGVVHVVALADVDRALGPRISERALCAPFHQGWELERFETTVYRSRIPNGASEELGFEVAEGTVSDTTAWLATFRRTA